MRAGDVVLGLDGRVVTGADDLIRILAGEKIGRQIRIEVLREGSRQVLTIVPDERARRR